MNRTRRETLVLFDMQPTEWLVRNVVKPATGFSKTERALIVIALRNRVARKCEGLSKSDWKQCLK